MIIDGARQMLIGDSSSSRCRESPLCHPHRALTGQVEELSRDLGFRLSDIELQRRDALPNVGELVGGLLKSDDKLLSSLQKLGLELNQPDPEEQQTVNRLHEICTR